MATFYFLKTIIHLYGCPLIRFNKDKISTVSRRVPFLCSIAEIYTKRKPSKPTQKIKDVKIRRHLHIEETCRNKNPHRSSRILAPLYYLIKNHTGKCAVNVY